MWGEAHHSLVKAKEACVSASAFEGLWRSFLLSLNWRPALSQAAPLHGVRWSTCWYRKWWAHYLLVWFVSCTHSMPNHPSRKLCFPSSVLLVVVLQDSWIHFFPIVLLELLLHAVWSLVKETERFTVARQGSSCFSALDTQRERERDCSGAICHFMWPFKISHWTFPQPTSIHHIAWWQTSHASYTTVTKVSDGDSSNGYPSPWLQGGGAYRLATEHPPHPKREVSDAMDEFKVTHACKGVD